MHAYFYYYLSNTSIDRELDTYWRWLWKMEEAYRQLWKDPLIPRDFWAKKHPLGACTIKGLVLNTLRYCEEMLANNVLDAWRRLCNEWQIFHPMGRKNYQTPRKEKMNELMEWNVFYAIHQYGLDTNTLHSIHTKLPCYLSAQFEVVVIPNVDQHQMFFMSKKKLWHWWFLNNCSL